MANKMVETFMAARRQSFRTEAKALKVFEEKVRPFLTVEGRQYVTEAILADNQCFREQEILPPGKPRGKAAQNGQE